jgi:hypothetical protein
MSLRWTADDGVQSATLVNGQLVTVKSSSLVPYFTLIYLGNDDVRSVTEASRWPLNLGPGIH